VRAHRTAEIAAAAWGRVKLTVAPALAGGGPDKILAALEELRERKAVALFGHEPDVSQLTARLLGTAAADRVAFKKGGAALFEISPHAPHTGRLLWFVPQKLLRHVRD
jgi:phosphohistidine phosphatase SixA